MLTANRPSQVSHLEQVELRLELGPSGLLVPLLTPDGIFARADELLLKQIREDSRIERKSARVAARLLGDYFSMWSNTADGGIIAIGIEKDGTFTGCMGVGTEHVNALEDSARQYCSDARAECKRICITNKDRKDDFVLLFHVPYRTDKVVKNHRGEAFIRSGDTIRKLKDDEVRELQIGKGEVHYELESVALNFPDDFDMDLVREFVTNVAARDGHTIEHTYEEVLAQQYLGVIQRRKFIPNNACCLLLARNPMLQFPGCKVRFQRFEGEHEGSGESYATVKDEVIEAVSIPRLIFRTEEIIASQLREYSAIGKDGRFYSVPEYPRFAWYEAIVNACGHRSYHLRNMNIFVKMFDDKLIVNSPGALPPTVTPQNIFEVQNARNPYLMRALQYFGFVKCANEGTRRMRDEMLKAHLPVPVFTEAIDGGGNVTVTLQNNHKQRRAFIDNEAARRVVSEAIYKTLSDEDLRLVNAVAEYGSLNVSQAARVISRDWATASSKLDKLRSKGILQRIHRKDLLRDPKSKYVLAGAKPS